MTDVPPLIRELADRCLADSDEPVGPLCDLLEENGLPNIARRHRVNRHTVHCYWSPAGLFAEETIEERERIAEHNVSQYGG